VHHTLFNRCRFLLILVYVTPGLVLHNSGDTTPLLLPCAAGDIDDEYLQELESSGRGASRTRAGRKTSLVAATV
jgi:hypothetical protein